MKITFEYNAGSSGRAIGEGGGAFSRGVGLCRVIAGPRFSIMQNFRALSYFHQYPMFLNQRKKELTSKYIDGGSHGVLSIKFQFSALGACFEHIRSGRTF